MENKKAEVWNVKPHTMMHSSPTTGKIHSAKLKKLIIAAMQYDFTQDLEMNEKGIFLKKMKKDGTGWCKVPERMILSPSTMNAPIAKIKMATIPEDILERRKEIGTNLMLNLERMFQERMRNVDELEANDVDRKNILNLINFFEENKIRIIAVEKYVHNGQIGGYIDAIGIWNAVPCIFEIKARNKDSKTGKHEIRKTDIIQACTYKTLLWNVTTYILLIDDFGEVNTYIVRKAKDEYSNLFNETMEHFMKFDIIDKNAIMPVHQINVKEILGEKPREEETNPEKN